MPPTSYIEHVTTYFVHLTGKGLSFSSHDLALVQQWEAAGIPAPLVCRALRRSLERRRQRGRVSLADCADDVARLYADHTSRGRGAVPQSGASSSSATDTALDKATLLAAVEAFARGLEEGPIRGAYRMVYRQLRNQPDDTLDLTALDAIDTRLLEQVAAQLPGKGLKLQNLSRQRARRLLDHTASTAALDRLTKTLFEQRVCENFGLALPSALWATIQLKGA